MEGQNFILPDPANWFEITDQHVPIHLLHTQAYCERQIYLEHVEGIEVEPTLEMKQGSKVHDSLEQKHKEKAKEVLTLKEALTKSVAEEITLISREVPVLGSSTYGRIDEIVFEPKRIVIIDDKPSPDPYFTNKVQVWGYCHTFSEMYVPELPIYGALRNEITGKVTWIEEFNEEQAERVMDGVRRIQGILSGKSKGEPTLNERKCRSCRFRQSCKK